MKPDQDRFERIGIAPTSIKTIARSPSYQKTIQRSDLCLGSARDAIQGLRHGEHIFGLTKGQFSMIDLAAAALEISGPADVSVWTWCVADYEIEAINGFISDGRIRHFRLVLDWAGARRDMPLVEDLQERFGADCIRVTKTHAKIVSVITDDWHILIRGSMNLNSNPRFEQFDVSEGIESWAVVERVMEELWHRAPALPLRKMTHAGAVSALGLPDNPDAPFPEWAPRSAAWF